MLTLLLLFLLFHNRLAIQNLLNVHQLARLSITKYYGQGGLNNRISLSLQYGVQESEIKVLAGLVSPRPLSLACRWPSFPCFVFTWLSLCAHTSAVSLCVLISFDQVKWRDQWFLSKIAPHRSANCAARRTSHQLFDAPFLNKKKKSQGCEKGWNGGKKRYWNRLCSEKKI